MQKVIVFEHGVETLSFFSMELANCFKQKGLSVFVYDLASEEPKRQIRNLHKFWKPGETFVVTFNFNGLRGEEEFYDQGELLWRKLQIPCVNIMVDHPFYYPSLLDKVKKELGEKLYYQVAIDRDHKKFMERFYPELREHLTFFPLAGTASKQQEKEYDVVFVGNYTPPSHFRKYMERIDDEYTAFYEGIIKDLIANPHTTMEQAFECHLKREMGELSEQDLRICMENMIFIDLYVRFYFRGNVIKTLAEADIPVHVWGAGLEAIPCEKPENIILMGPTDTAGCLNALAKAKVALNVMPWFKDGSHDRVYSAMLNHAVCVTDESVYLKEQLKEDEQVLFYSLDDYSQLPDRIKELLADQRKRETIAQQGFAYATEHHTWRERSENILNLFL